MRLVDIGEVEKAIREYFKKQIDKGAPNEWSILEYNADLQDIMAHKVPTFYDEDKILKETSESRKAAELGKLLVAEIDFGLKRSSSQHDNDLISRKSVKKILRDLHIDNMQVNGKGILEYISEIPTAFNTECLIDRLNEESDASCENFDKYAEEHAICKSENTLSAGLIRTVEIIRECEEDGNG